MAMTGAAGGQHYVRRGCGLLGGQAAKTNSLLSVCFFVADQRESQQFAV